MGALDQMDELRPQSAHGYFALLFVVVISLLTFGKDLYRQHEEGAEMPLLANNAASKLAASISATDTSISLQAGTGTMFPAPATGDWFPLTMISPAGTYEIVRCTSRNGDVLEILRAQEGTSAKSFNAGDRAELRLTAAVINEKFDKAGGTITGSVTLTADMTTYRPASPGTGVLFLGNSGSKYLFFDGTNYTMPGGQLYVNGSQVWHTGNFNPAAYMPLTGANFSGNFGIYNTSPTVMFYDTDWGPRQLHCNGGLIGFLNSGGGWAVYSDNSGNLIASANVAAYSDRKHKTDIRPVENALALVERLRGVRYTDVRTKAKRLGVIAQEIQEVLPEVVGEGPDGLHVDYGNIVGALIPAIQELAAEVRMLKRGL